MLETSARLLRLLSLLQVRPDWTGAELADDWRTFRVDRMEGPLGPPGARFTPRRPPEDDVAGYVSRAISTTPYRYRARILMHAPVHAVARKSSPAAGRLEAIDDHTCVLHTGSESLLDLAVHVAVKGFDFEVLDPPELNEVLRELSDRLRRAAGDQVSTDAPDA